MTDNNLQTLSAAIDNEADKRVIKQIAKDEDMSQAWSRYHLIGDVMRDEVPASFDPSIADAIAQQIDQEPTVLAPKPRSQVVETIKANVVKFVKPAGQMAIAASAAAMMVITVQNTGQQDPVTPSPVVQTNGALGFAAPVSLNTVSPTRTTTQQELIQHQRRFHALLADHQQQTKLYNPQAEKVNKTSQEDNNQ
ncbi:sigma-E factor negative regulatory protein [Thalassotalea agarivorans]|uniref:Anti-sigma-E factor RseA n=1 Tax=Thalassotalea agarivorans TaxID=349064 RepID=A0A1I0FZB4_THASX|nr:RseA family anti-sigma factor [Thalassotalea agarivorans]SET63037.1 sigma-E factor negative regulatory protein RseA [Thalassotalea agarivorans]